MRPSTVSAAVAASGMLILTSSDAVILKKPCLGNEGDGQQNGRLLLQPWALKFSNLRWPRSRLNVFRWGSVNFARCEQLPVVVSTAPRWKFSDLSEPRYLPGLELSDDGLAEFPDFVEVLESAWMFPTTHRFVGATARAVSDLNWLPWCRRYYVAIFVRADDLDEIIQRQLRKLVSSRCPSLADGAAATKASKSLEINTPGRALKQQLSIHDQDVREIAWQVLDLVCQPEVTKSFCFLFSRTFGQHQALSFLGGVFDGLEKGPSATDDPEMREQLVLDCQTILRAQAIHEGSKVIFTCNADSPPLCSISGSLNAEDPLKFWGGLRGPAMSILLHRMFLRDPYSSKAAKTGILGDRLIRHMLQQIQKRVSAIAAQIDNAEW